MKIYLIILISNLIGLKFKTFVTSDYIHTKECIETRSSNKKDCHSVKSDISEDEKGRIIACCYVSYSHEDEGNVNKCVPIYKTKNGIHMYREQVKNLGGTSINIDCSAKKIILPLLYIFGIFLIL